MDSNCISFSAPSSEITLIIPRPKDKVQETDRSVTTKVGFVVLEPWRVSAVEVSPMPPPAPVPMYPKPSVHLAVEQFVQNVANVKGVKCIAVEEAEGQIVHFTTFADPVSEQSRAEIYAIEAATIDAFPDLVFDFHLRLASEAEGGTPIPIPGQRFFAVWGDLHENAG